MSYDWKAYEDRFSKDFELRRSFYLTSQYEMQDPRHKRFEERYFKDRFKGYEHEFPLYESAAKDSKSCPSCGYSPIPNWCRVCKSCLKKEQGYGRSGR